MVLDANLHRQFQPTAFNYVDIKAPTLPEAYLDTKRIQEPGNAVGIWRHLKTLRRNLGNQIDGSAVGSTESRPARSNARKHSFLFEGC